MQQQFPKLPRLTKAGKVLVIGAIVLFTPLPFVPLIRSMLQSPNVVDSGMPCNSVWPDNASMVMVATDIGGGTTVTRPAMILTDQPRVIYLCNARSEQ